MTVTSRGRPNLITQPCLAEVRGPAMGSTLHIIATGDHEAIEGLVRWATARVAELEQKWSRFLPTSDVSRLNQAPGTAVKVSGYTLTLVERALEARELSGGRFDPTLLQALSATGYDRTFVSIKTPAGLPALDTRAIGLGKISVDHIANTIMLGPSTGFDPGGIGKGLAADLVAEEMIERGAAGALVNIGGDVRCIGDGPADGAWLISCGDDVAGVSNQVIALDQGGVASSTRRRRTWKRRVGSATVEAHHLIDPTTSQPSPHAANLVTVIAGSCADAEWLATSVAADGALPADRSVLGGATVFLTTADGETSTAGSPERFLQS